LVLAKKGRGAEACRIHFWGIRWKGEGGDGKGGRALYSWQGERESFKSGHSRSPARERRSFQKGCLSPKNFGGWGPMLAA